MKTVNGVPQFVKSGRRDKLKINIDDANTAIKKWAAKRTCVNCTNLHPNKMGSHYCEKVGLTAWTKPETFSCVDFSESNQDSIQEGK